jgi:hypothetical protein
MAEQLDVEKYKNRILDQKESKSCNRLAVNYREQINKTKQPTSSFWKELADIADLRTEDLRERETGRRPDIPYIQLKLFRGTVLYIPETDIEATVFSNRTLSYKGREVYITPLENELIDSGIPRNKIAGKWTVKETGENLNAIYNKKWPKK